MRVVLADDHVLFRDGLATLLGAAGIEIVGQAGDGAGAVALALAERPDVVLMDLGMPGVGGLEATRRIKDAAPEIKVVILTVSETDEDLFEAIRSGAHGYVVKSTSGPEFLELLEALDRGEAPLSRGLALRIVRHLALEQDGHGPRTTLTPREREVVRLVADGRTNREIAERLSISETTVKSHMTNILAKLHLQHRTEVVAYAHRLHLDGSGDPS